MKTKANRNISGNTSFDVSYAEILAEVQKLQQMLDGNVQTEKKQRKKRTLKAHIEQSQPESSIGQIQSQDTDDDVVAASGEPDEQIQDTPQVEAKSSSHRYKVSNLDEIREKISEVKDLIKEADPAAAEAVAAIEAQSPSELEIEAEAGMHSDSEGDSKGQSSVEPQMPPDPDAEMQSYPSAETEAKVQQDVEGKPQAEIFQTTQEVVEENADIELKEQVSLGSEQDNEPVAKSKKTATSKAESSVAKAPKATKTTKAKATKAPKAAGTTSDLDAYFLEGQQSTEQDAGPVGLAEERHAAQLAKHGVKNEDEIIKANLEHDKSGAEWGGNVNLEDDPNLDQPQP
jgi:hypothetical protein